MIGLNPPSYNRAIYKCVSKNGASPVKNKNIYWKVIIYIYPMLYPK